MSNIETDIVRFSEYFADELAKIIRFWEARKEMTTRQRLEGIAQGFMELIEGLPSDVHKHSAKFALAPNPTPADQAFARSTGIALHPDNTFISEQVPNLVNADNPGFIRQLLHDSLKRRTPNSNEDGTA